MNERDLFWLVGILEGEGAFCHGPPSRPNKPRVILTSSDFDVVERAQHLMGGCVYRVNRTPKWRTSPINGRPYRDVFNLTLNGRPALELMRLVRPHMSRRRKLKIDEILRQTPPIGTSPCTPGKLNAKDKVLIRREYATGRYSQAQIARKYGVSQSRISGIIRSKSGGD